MRIDCHVHFTPPSLRDDFSHYEQTEPYWALLAKPKSGKPGLQDWVTPEQMIADMDKAGIDQVVLLGEPLASHENCVERNNIALQLVNRYPERIIAFAIIQPLAGQKAIGEVKRCLDGGMRGLGEMGHYCGGYRFNSKEFLNVVEVCVQYQVPINLHSNEEIGHFYFGKSTIPLRDYYQLACDVPELRIIMAHWGGGLFFYEMMPDVKKKLKNVFYDTAASPLLYPTDQIFPIALQILDHHKILYGSDYPLRICPAKQKVADFQPFLAEIDDLKLDEEKIEDIFGKNFLRLFSEIDDLNTDPVSITNKPTMQSKQPIINAAMIDEKMSVSFVAHNWPETQAVFNMYKIPWQDQPVPVWEPIIQAMAAHGMDETQREMMINELNEAIQHGIN